MKNSKRSTTTSLIVLALFLIPAPALSQNVIEQRDKLMKANAAALKEIRAAAKESDYATLQAKGKEIVAAMDKVPDLFPKGSLSEDSLAVPAIWEKWDEFRKHVRTTSAAAEGLVKAAAAKDDAQVQEQVKAIGGMTSGACGGCHLSFNKKRMKKE
jgi:cytochrome c556